jgi:hypothetical protein
MLHEEKPSLEEVLEHHGIKGMKWGVRKAGAPSNSDIHGARQRILNQQTKIGRQRRKAVKATVTRSSKAPKERAKLKDMKKTLLKNPDRVTALHMTNGEAAAHALLLAHPMTAPGAVTSVASREVAARVIRSKQARGSYDKKK